MTALSVVRIIAMDQMNFKDLPYTLTKALLWSMVEIQCAIIVVNLPLLRPVLIRILPIAILGRSNGTNGDSCTLVGNNQFNHLGDDSIGTADLRQMDIRAHRMGTTSSQTPSFDMSEV